MCARYDATFWYGLYWFNGFWTPGPGSPFQLSRLFHDEVHSANRRGSTAGFAGLQFDAIYARGEAICRNHEGQGDHRTSLFHKGRSVDGSSGKYRLTAFLIHHLVCNAQRWWIRIGDARIVHLRVESYLVRLFETVAAGGDHFHLVNHKGRVIGKQIRVERSAEIGHAFEMFCESNAAEAERLSVVRVDVERRFIFSKILPAAG